ncbi:MobH family relaxase [Endozoicomonas sp. ALC066]|uniref:MobH family relaxase n=1 Tax=Endozoicomonas sp. ALC066 TaxID=3403078 RepID=UPI003BB6E9B6
MLSLFKRQSEPSSPVIPEGWFRTETPDYLLRTDYRQDLITRIKRELSVTEAVWQNCYIPMFHNWARLTQALPASESHHHSYPGGLLDHSLECALNALRLRRGYVLPPNEPVENTSMKAERYTYAVCVCSLLHDCGKMLTDIEVVTGTPKRYSLWSPWAGKMDEGSLYAFKFRVGRKHGQHEWAGTSLLSTIVPLIGLKWLQEDSDLMILLFAQMSGKQSLAGPIGEIVRKADKGSVSKALGGKQVSPQQSVATETHTQPQKVVGLHEQLLMAIRYLFHEGHLSVNRPGAAGWVKGDTAWLVSKATVEAASTHLFSEGIKTVPKNAARVFDILVEHDLVQPTDDGKAIWKCKIHDEDKDWHQELTMLKFKLSTLWPNGSPADFNGSITPINSPKAVKAAKQKTEQAEAITQKSTPIKEVFQADQNDESELRSPDQQSLESTAAPPSGFMDSVPPVEVYDEEMTQGPGHIKNQTDLPFEDPIKQASTPIKSKMSPQDANKKIANDFLAWLKAGVTDRSIIINDSKAPVHIVDGKVLLVSPHIFKRYIQENLDVKVSLSLVAGRGKDSDAKKVQSCFQKLGLNEKTQGGRNLVKCEVRGDRKTSVLNGFLMPDPTTIFEDRKVPSSNPHITILP